MQTEMQYTTVILLLSMLLTACSGFSNPVPAEAPTPVVTPTATPEPTATPAFVFGSDPFSQGMVARRNGDYARAIAAFQATLAGNPAPDVMQEAQFRLGEAYWLSNDDASATTSFSSYLIKYPTGPHAAETHYFLADAYRVLKDWPNSLEQFKAYRDVSQALVGDTDGAIADLLVLAGDPDGAVQQYDRALQDNTMTATARINILLRAADVLSGRGQPALAAARYETALALATDARTRADLDLRAGEAYAAAGQMDQAIAHWSDAFVKYPDQQGAYKSLVDLLNRSAAVDDYQRGLVDYYAASYDAAISAFQNHLKSDSPRAGDAHYFTASSYARKGSYSQAIAEYDVILKTLPKDKRVADAYMGKASAYGSLGKMDDAVAVYKKFAAALPDDGQADDALWRAATLLDSAKRYSDAALVYESLQTKYPSRERAADALFWAGMDYYRAKDYQTAAARWQSITKNYAKSSFYPRALFWLGKASQARGQNDVAKTSFSQAAGLESGYYSWRAQDVVKPPQVNVSYDSARYTMGNVSDRADLEKWLVGWSKTDRTVIATLDPAIRGDIRFRRGAELLRLDRTVEARREFASLVSAKQDDAHALYALALYLRDNNLYSLSMESAERIARLGNAAGAPEAPRLLGMLRYPTYYSDLVLAETKANQVDPLLYFGLIRQESSFNPWVTSSADARGLGQIIPSTAKEIAQKLGHKNFSLDQLYLPFVNLRFGVWYFAQDLKMFDEPIYALAAYNGGAGRTKQWQRSDLDLAVEEITASESALYVRIVYTNWRQYQTLYP